MRQNHTVQLSLHHQIPDEHEIGQKLAIMSQWLDGQPALLELVGRDIGTDKTTGRPGLSADSALRCGLLLQLDQMTYRELAFRLLDSVCYRAFARMEKETPAFSTLQSVISRIREQTWDAVSQAVVSSARADGLERCRRIRIDSTVTETHIAPPRDSQMLVDAVRIMQRLALRAPTTDRWPDRLRRARRRNLEIAGNLRRAQRQSKYRDLVKVVLEQRSRFVALIEQMRSIDPLWVIAAEPWVPLIDQVLDQTRRRVFEGESVPANEKLLSLFETHTDLIVKAPRKSSFGHKLNLTTGTSGLVLDVVVERGNPADSARLIPMIERHQERYGVPCHTVAADGGYTSRDNLTQAKAMGVKQVGFHKRRGIPVEEMTSSRWVYRQLKRFRAGIEACISYLKRCFGLTRCLWKGWSHFQRYVHSAVACHNLLVYAQLKS